MVSGGVMGDGEERGGGRRSAKLKILLCDEANNFSVGGVRERIQVTEMVTEYHAGIY